jgi:uncharacterized protein YjfI (DUF2170 family)
VCFQNKNAKREEKVIMRDFKDLKIAVAGTGARDIIGSTKKNHDN